MAAIHISARFRAHVLPIDHAARLSWIRDNCDPGAHVLGLIKEI
jgi:hypothetical protein